MQRGSTPHTYETKGETWYIVRGESICWEGKMLDCFEEWGKFPMSHLSSLRLCKSCLSSWLRKEFVVFKKVAVC